MSLPNVPLKRVIDYRKYPPALKHKIARRYIASEFSYAVAAPEYRLDNKDVVKEFVRWFRKQQVRDQAAIASSISNKSPQSQLDLRENSTVEFDKEMIRLRKVAHEAELKAEAWRTLVIEPS